MQQMGSESSKIVQVCCLSLLNVAETLPISILNKEDMF
jgi:hypothetical protein